MRRILAAGGAAVLLLLSSAGPAAAAPPEFLFASPTQNQRFATQTVTLDVTARMNGGTLRGDVVVTWAGPAGVPVPGETRQPSGNDTSERVLLENQPFPWNGAYSVTVQATGRRDGIIAQPDEPGSVTRSFVVDAPPAPPTGVTTSLGTNRTVTVQWARNSEPDLVGYSVERQLGSEAFETVTATDTTTTRVVDESTTEAAGTYRYRVVAFRTSAEAGKLQVSNPSEPSSVRVPAPPPTTTTTTVAERSGPGGGSSRTVPTTTTGSSTAGGGSTSSPSSGSSTTPALSGAGKVDLSGFTTLLEQARQAGQVPSRTTATTEPDGSFDEKLPFAARPRRSGDGEEMTLLDETPVAGDDGDDVQSLAFLAGGLLVTVVVMFLLWVQSQVRKVETLEPVAPREPPARPRRRRPPPSAWERFGAEPDDLAPQAHEAAPVG